VSQPKGLAAAQQSRREPPVQAGRFGPSRIRQPAGQSSVDLAGVGRWAYRVVRLAGFLLIVGDPAV
jgi:hypothetical protein